MNVIDKCLLDEVSAQAKESPQLRMNFIFHKSLDKKCHRFLNAVEPRTEVSIYKHPKGWDLRDSLRKGELWKCGDRYHLERREEY